LTRVRRGLYLAVPIEAEDAAFVTPEDPLLLAKALYSPCYIAGWSAAEHWGMTEQIFRSTFVATAASIRRKEESFLGAQYHLVRVAPDRITGIGTIWRGRERVPISGPERTLVDAARDPSWIGGVRHLAEVLTRYRTLAGSSPGKVAAELRVNGSGAAAKRLGYLAERTWPGARGLIKLAMERRSAGVIKLDPTIRTRGRLNKRWGLWVNADIGASA
jgi:predicted transcriptional regulator of viral defense system